MVVILFLMELLQQVAVEAVVLTLHHLAHQHQPQVVLEAAAFGQAQQAERHLHQDKVLLVALAQVLLTIPVVVVAVLLRLVVTHQTQDQELAVAVEQVLRLVCLEFL
jgi:hypothetical protein